MTTPSFICATCGKEHPGLPTDYGYRLPDEVHALAYIDRYLRSRSNADLCTLDETRHFIRGIIPIPFAASEDEFCWGVWVEVSKEHHDIYANGFHTDLGHTPRFAAALANDIPGYGGTAGLAVDVQLQDGNSRPAFYFPSSESHAMAHEQRNGISAKRHHDILEAVGHFKDKNSA